MKTVLLSAMFILLAQAAFGGPEVIIKERAKELRDQNNVRQGVAPPTQPAPAPAVAAPPTPQQQSLNRFQTGLAGIKDAPTAAQKQQLSADFLGAAQGSRPSQTTVNKVVNSVTAALAEKQLPAASRARLVQELDAVLNPAKYPQAKMSAIYADIQAIFQANGISRTASVGIVEDIKALGAETK
jgi:hypothetical protein